MLYQILCRFLGHKYDGKDLMWHENYITNEMVFRVPCKRCKKELRLKVPL